MNKKALLACLLIMTMLLSSCSLVVTDTKVEAATPILTVGDMVYTKSEMQSYVTEYLNYVAQNEYQSYGYVLTDINSESVKAQALDIVINMLIEEAIVHEKAAEMGADQLTEEQQAKITSTMDMYWQYLEMLGMASTPTDLTNEEEIAAYKEATVASLFGINSETLKDEQVHENLRAMVTKDVTVSADDVKAEYDNRVQTAMVSYASNVSKFADSYNNGETLYYQPAGIRLVKNLLIKLNSEDQTTVTSLRSKANTQQNAAASYKAVIEATGANADQMLAKVTVTLTATDDVTYTADVTDTFDATEDAEELAVISNVRNYAAAKALAEKYDELASAAAAAAFAAIDAKADEALAKLAEGADWDTVMAEYTEDPGMQGTSATAKTGYAVCEGYSSFDAEFVKAAMGMTKLGEHTGKVASESFGYFILQYAGEVTEGAVDYDTVSAEIEAELLSAKQNEVYSAAVESWVNGAKTVIDKSAMN